MKLVKDGITRVAIDPNDIQRFKSLGYVEVKPEKSAAKKLPTTASPKAVAEKQKKAKKGKKE